MAWASSRSSTIALSSHLLFQVRWANSRRITTPVVSGSPVAMPSSHGPSSRSRSAIPCKHVISTAEVVASGIGVQLQEISLMSAKKSRRPSAAEIQAERATNEQLPLSSLVVNGTQFDGQPDHIARLLNAMKQTL